MLPYQFTLTDGILGRKATLASEGIPIAILKDELTRLKRQNRDISTCPFPERTDDALHLHDASRIGGSASKNRGKVHSQA
jgi:hypothetical protein